MALNLYEKVPDSGNWFLDQSDFPDVYRTVYAKGVITDFKKLQDDPIKVAPLVKVKVGDTEYDDYLPLFFRPKPLYWDDEEHKAVDINQEEKYYEKAWMSFRGDDEVAVLLHATEEDPELKPFAVLAFADGVPRIGEDIVKIDLTPTYFQASNGFDYYDGKEKGPDDKDLGLRLKCERFLISNENSNGEQTYPNYRYHSFRSLTWQYTPGYPEIVVVDPSIFNNWTGWTWYNVRIDYYQHDTYRTPKSIWTDSYMKYKHLAPIGPILCWILEYRDVYTNAWGEDVVEEYDDFIPWSGPSISKRTAYDLSYWEGHPEYDELVALCEATIAADAINFDYWWNIWTSYAGSWTYPPPTLPTLTPGSTWTWLGEGKAAIYTKELYDRAKEAKDPPEEFTGSCNVYDEFEGVKEAAVYVRPHTKEDLQAAGMWPKKEA